MTGTSNPKRHELDSLGSPAKFAYEWTSFPDLIPEYERQFEGWVSSVDPSAFDGAYVVDAGCGTGRNSFWASRWGARRVFAFDVTTSTVEVARRNLMTTPHVEVACESIYLCELPDDEMADIAMSIGVVHHLADPQLAVERLIYLVRPGGQVLLWVYAREGNEWLLRYLTPLRALSSRLPMRISNCLATILTCALLLYCKTPLPKTMYLRQVSSFQFWHLKSIVLDQLFPKIAHYWSRSEVLALLEEVGLDEISIKWVNGMSWSISGKKPLTRIP